jgi:hypothetical protein
VIGIFASRLLPKEAFRGWWCEPGHQRFSPAFQSTGVTSSLFSATTSPKRNRWARRNKTTRSRQKNGVWLVYSEFLLELSDRERDLILKHTFADDDLTGRLRIVRRRGIGRIRTKGKAATVLEPQSASFADEASADLVDQLPYFRCFIRGGMVRQRRFQFLPGSNFIAGFQQRYPQMISESWSLGILLHKGGEGFDGTVTHSLF